MAYTFHICSCLTRCKAASSQGYFSYVTVVKNVLNHSNCDILNIVIFASASGKERPPAPGLLFSAGLMANLKPSPQGRPSRFSSNSTDASPPHLIRKGVSGLPSFRVTLQPLDVRPWTSEALFTHLLSSCQAQVSLHQNCKLLSLSIGSPTFVKAGVCHKIINHYCSGTASEVTQQGHWHHQHAI